MLFIGAALGSSIQYGFEPSFRVPSQIVSIAKVEPACIQFIMSKQVYNYFITDLHLRQNMFSIIVTHHNNIDSFSSVCVCLRVQKVHIITMQFNFKPTRPRSPSRLALDMFFASTSVNKKDISVISIQWLQFDL